jgi:hypothetical protein
VFAACVGQWALIFSTLTLNYVTSSTTLELNQQEWMSVLKLCTLWEFADVRGRAIQELTKESIGSIEKIECGKSYDVKEMLLEGYIELLKRDETISDEEGERLGWKTASKLHFLREQYISGQYSTFVISQTCAGCGRQCGGRLYRSCCQYGGYYPHTQVTLADRNQHDFTEVVQKEFAAEL